MAAVGGPPTAIIVGREEEFGGEWVFCAWSVSRVSVVIDLLLELKGKDASSHLFRVLDFIFQKWDISCEQHALLHPSPYQIFLATPAILFLHWVAMVMVRGTMGLYYCLYGATGMHTTLLG